MSKCRNFYKFYSGNSPYLINSLEAGLFADSYYFSNFDIQNDKMEGTIVPVRLEPIALKRAVIDHLNELGSGPIKLLACGATH